MSDESIRVPDEGDVRELAANMKRNGQQNPISILPDGTIVCGHNRVAAARLLGWNAVACKSKNCDR